jgi:hypothetical protein
MIHFYELCFGLCVFVSSPARQTPIQCVVFFKISNVIAFDMQHPYSASVVQMCFILLHVRRLADVLHPVSASVVRPQQVFTTSALNEKQIRQQFTNPAMVHNVCPQLINRLIHELIN